MKNRGIAIVLAIFLGGLGIHRFYVGDMKTGTTFLLFFWTGIPMLIAIIDALRVGFMGEEAFQKRYSN